MKKKVTIVTLSIIVLVLALSYMAYLFLIPALLNSEKNISKLEYILLRNTGFNLELKSFKIKTSPLFVIKLNTENFAIFNKTNDKIIDIADINSNIDLKRLSSSKIYAKKITVNTSKLQKKSVNKKKQRNFNLDFSKLPQIDIKDIELNLENTNITIENLLISNNKAAFNAKLSAPFLQNSITLGKKGQILLNKNTILADNFYVTLGKTHLCLDGKLYDKHAGYDFNVVGNNLPVNDIENSLLFYQKSQDPAKKFIENFKNYAGDIDLNINISKQGIYGEGVIKNMRAATVLFDIPLSFKEVILNFCGKTITSKAEGVLGGEKVYHELEIINLGSSDKEVTGIVTANLTDTFKYIPNLYILNSTDAKVIYNIKNQKIDVKYYLNVPKNSDLFYQNAYLGLRDKNRRFFFQTYKDGDYMYIKQYDYSLEEDNKIKNVILGDGLLIKKDGKMIPQYITCKTNGYAPASVTGSFGKYIRGGEFCGDLKYDFTTDQILGKFELINTQFKDFYVKMAKIIANKTLVNIKAEGTYFKEIFNCDVNTKNNFNGDIIVHNMDLFLNKLEIKRTQNKRKPPSRKEIQDIRTKVQDADITIENWNIKLNEISKDRIKLENIQLHGSLKNDVFNFTMKELAFADGLLNAVGKYDFKNGAANIDFTAENINSNTVADVVFNLPGQVEGIADAKLQMKTIGQLDDIKANAEFHVAEGFLPQLGSTEFMIKNTKKIQIADIINVDLTQKEAFQSDIKGTFSIDNSKIKDAKLTSQQQYLSMFIEGDYELNEQNANLNLFGRYNKEAPKGVKIALIPLNWILKVVFRPEKSKELYKSQIEQIPAIDALKENEKIFRVNIKGDLNDNNVKVEIKGIE